MPTLTLKDLPAEIHARLKASAARNRRSMAREALVLIEAGLGAPPIDAEQHLATARAIRERHGLRPVDPDAIDADRRAGRP